ncbi:MAG: hypothetical protein AAF725_09415 [Acidobacteriota bacterium]
MHKKRRGLGEIRTLGQRGSGNRDQSALLRASVVEAELQRLSQERRLLEQRLASLESSARRLEEERDRLLSGLSVRQTGDQAVARRDPRAFHLRY